MADEEIMSYTTLGISILSMIISLLTHIKHSKCSNCIEIDMKENV